MAFSLTSCFVNLVMFSQCMSYSTVLALDIFPSLFPLALYLPMLTCLNSPCAACSPMLVACSLIDKKNSRRYDDCLKYTVVSAKKALKQAGLEKESCASGYSKLDLTRVGVLIGTGMGGLQVFQDGGWEKMKQWASETLRKRALSYWALRVGCKDGEFQGSFRGRYIKDCIFFRLRV